MSCSTRYVQEGFPEECKMGGWGGTEEWTGKRGNNSLSNGNTKVVSVAVQLHKKLQKLLIWGHFLFPNLSLAFILKKTVNQRGGTTWMLFYLLHQQGLPRIPIKEKKQRVRNNLNPFNVNTVSWGSRSFLGVDGPVGSLGWHQHTLK